MEFLIGNVGRKKICDCLRVKVILKKNVFKR